MNKKVEEVLKPLGDRGLDPCDPCHWTGTIGSIVDNIDELDERHQLPVAKAYSALYQLYDAAARSTNAETEQWLAYYANVVREALGKPPKWFVYIRQQDRPRKGVLCDVVPCGTYLDKFFTDVEKKTKDRDRYQPTTSIKDESSGMSFRLSSDMHLSNYRFGNSRRLVYVED